MQISVGVHYITIKWFWNVYTADLFACNSIHQEKQITVDIDFFLFYKSIQLTVKKNYSKSAIIAEYNVVTLQETFL